MRVALRPAAGLRPSAAHASPPTRAISIAVRKASGDYVAQLTMRGSVPMHGLVLHLQQSSFEATTKLSVLHRTS